MSASFPIPNAQTTPATTATTTAAQDTTLQEVVVTGSRDSGAGADTLLRLVHPDDRHRVTTAAARALASSETGELEFRVVRPDGKLPGFGRDS